MQHPICKPPWCYPVFDLQISANLPGCHLEVFICKPWPEPVTSSILAQEGLETGAQLYKSHLSPGGIICKSPPNWMRPAYCIQYSLKIITQLIRFCCPAFWFANHHLFRSNQAIQHGSLQTITLPNLLDEISFANYYHPVNQVRHPVLWFANHHLLRWDQSVQHGSFQTIAQLDSLNEITCKPPPSLYLLHSTC